MEFESIYTNPEEMLQDAEQQGIIKLSNENNVPTDLPALVFPICIIDSQRWIDFLHKINDKTNNPGEKVFVQGLIQSFKTFCNGSGVDIKNFKPAISKKDVKEFKKKFNKIKTIDELLKKWDS